MENKINPNVEYDQHLNNFLLFWSYFRGLL